MLETLNNSEFAMWMIVSPWAYPTLLTLHGLGMAAVVGLTLMISLRVLGWPSQIPLGPYAATIPFGIAAYVVNAISGIALFVADAVGMWANPAFQFKLVSIAVGMVVLWLLLRGPVRRARMATPGDGPFVPTTGDKVLAVLAILIWSSAVIVSGRLIAYVMPDLF